MSSYLNIYGIPKEGDKPIEIVVSVGLIVYTERYVMK